LITRTRLAGLEHRHPQWFVYATQRWKFRGGLLALLPQPVVDYLGVVVALITCTGSPAGGGLFGAQLQEEVIV
jgi:hypothetical protein